MAANLTAINIILEVPGGTQELYVKTNEIIQPDKLLPHGLISHCAGPMPGGWRVCDVWESQEFFNLFLSQRLQPALQQVGAPQPLRAIYPLSTFASPGFFSLAGQGTGGGAINVVFIIPDGTERQYEKTLDLLKFRENPPRGQLAHAAGPMAGGWRVVDTWESQAALDAFFKERLVAVLDKVGWQPIPHIYPLYQYLNVKELVKA